MNVTGDAASIQMEVTTNQRQEKDEGDTCVWVNF